MGRKRKQRRQSHGSAWHWQQTDCWYYTLPSTRKRVGLFDDEGQRIRGKANKELAEQALAKEKLSWEGDGSSANGGGEWNVARVCSEYLQYCERGVATASISKGHRDSAVSWLNDLCSHCGALPTAQLKKGHIQTWIEQHTTWRSPATRRGVIAIVLAAFNRVEDLHGISSPLKGLKKPASRPRLESIAPDDERSLYEATEPCFRNFLFAAVQTGLRPFCELARITADDVEESERGMMWRVYSSKTKKTRKIPVRPEVAELTRQLMKTAPRGSGSPLLRNTKGNPWQRMTGVVRFITLREKLGWDRDPVKSKYSCYTCRHTFAHRMLSGYWNDGVGCSIETLAELIGDTPKVAFDHYGREWGQHYQAPLWAAIGEGGNHQGKEGGTSSKTEGERTPRRRPKRAGGGRSREANNSAARGAANTRKRKHK
ncbi:MAG: tyrosine-type recombinase/integrase [Planctomycetota bacterium]|nr:tyrosine-type recombinase/integrase [Planctomycetota bacterium]